MDISRHRTTPCVLVVDDHDLSRRHTVRALREIDCRVKQASNGEEGLRDALALRPNLIFLDLHLPDTDGFSLLKKIRDAWPEHESAPSFVLLTGDTFVCSPRKLNALRLVALLGKPVEAKAIMHLSRRYLRQTPGVREDREHPFSRPPTEKLRTIFLDDLEHQLPSLDLCLSRLEWESAKAILHQVIAASSICQDSGTEHYGRWLNECLNDPIRPDLVAHAYYGLRKAITLARQSIRHHESPRAFP